MNSKRIINEIEGFIKRNPKSKESGKIISAEDFDSLSSEVDKLIPEWYKEILFSYPVSGLEIGIPNDFGNPEFIGKPIEELPLMPIRICTLEEIEEETLEYFPACELVQDNYLCIARDEYSTGERIFINTKEENPKVLMVFHDMGESNSELIDNAEVLTEKFSEIFSLGKIETDS